MAALKALGQAVEAIGKIYPTTLETTQLTAELADGQIVKGEANLDRPKYDRSLKIKKVWLEPSGRIYEDAKRVV